MSGGRGERAGRLWRRAVAPLAMFVCGALACAGLTGCEPDLRVPYIPPTLANWPQPYAGIDGLTVDVFIVGTIRAPEAAVLRGGSVLRTREMPVIAAVIRHPRHGLIVCNTGIKEPVESDRGGGWLPSALVPEATPAEPLSVQMRAAGFDPAAVRWVILTDLRMGHTGDVESFPHARVVVTKAEQEYALERPAGYRRADVDHVANWKFVDFEPPTPLATFRASVDLLGDGSVELIDAAGTTPGSMAVLVRLRERPLLLAGSLAAVQETVRYAARPAAAYAIESWWDTIWRLKRFRDLVPALLVVPDRDVTGVATAGLRSLTVHAPAVSTPAPTAGTLADRLRRLLPGPL
jgi:N-acyl homoserine lactone hydrolase